MTSVVWVLRMDILPVIQVSVSLYGLRSKVDRMAGEQKVVLGPDGKGVAHECCGVDDKGAGHGAGNAVRSLSVFVHESSSR